MADIVNLKHRRKQKTRAEKDRKAEANRAAHGTPKHLRQKKEAEDERAARQIEGHRLDEDDEPRT